MIHSSLLVCVCAGVCSLFRPILPIGADVSPTHTPFFSLVVGFDPGSDRIPFSFPFRKGSRPVVGSDTSDGNPRTSRSLELEGQWELQQSIGEGGATGDERESERERGSLRE